MEKRYNSHKKNYTILNEGERFCSKCKGKGKVPRHHVLLNNGKSVLMLMCDKCLGEGKIDWIEEVVGKKQKVNEIPTEAAVREYVDSQIR